MKKWYVYEIINLMGSVEHVGETTAIQNRLKQHTKVKPSSKHRSGKFYGRQDLVINIVAEFDNRPDAYALQIELQILYGLEPDNIKCTKNNKGRKISNQTKLKMSLAKKGKPRPQSVKDKIKNTMLSKRNTIIP